MSTTELKHIITEQLMHIDDVSFLNKIKDIIESKLSDDLYLLSDFQKERLKAARQELNNQQTISNNDLQKEVNQWLSEK